MKIIRIALYGLPLAVASISGCAVQQPQAVTVEKRHALPVVLERVAVTPEGGETLITGFARLRVPNTSFGSHVDVTVLDPAGGVVVTGTLPYSTHLGGTRRSAREAAFAGRLNAELQEGSTVVLEHHDGRHDG